MKTCYKKNHRRSLSSAVIVRSVEAKLTYQYLNDLAAESDAAGLLLDNGHPYTVQQIVAFTGLTIRRQQLALEELAFHGLIQKRGDGAIEVLGWNDDQSPSRDTLRKRTNRSICPLHGGTNCSLCTPETADNSVVAMQRGQYLDLNTRSSLKPLDLATQRDHVTPSGDKSPSGDSAAAESGQIVASVPPWVAVLLGLVREIWRTPLDKLSPSELHTLGQYHCLLFANCTKSEGKNLANATKVAKGLAGMAASDDFADMTVAQYVAYGQRLHEMRKRARWFDPWLIKAVVVFAK